MNNAWWSAMLVLAKWVSNALILEIYITGKSLLKAFRLSTHCVNSAYLILIGANSFVFFLWQIGGIYSENIRILETDSSTEYALSPESLTKAISQDISLGLIPFFLCATVRKLRKNIHWELLMLFIYCFPHVLHLFFNLIQSSSFFHGLSTLLWLFIF